MAMIVMTRMKMLLIHNNRRNNPESKNAWPNLQAKHGKHVPLHEYLSNDLGEVAAATGALLVVTDDDDNDKNTNLDSNTCIGEDDCPTTTVEFGLSSLLLLLSLSLWSSYLLHLEKLTITTNWTTITNQTTTKSGGHAVALAAVCHHG